MDGLSHVAGRRTLTIEIGGKVYTLSPTRLADYADRETYILSLRPDPWDIVRRMPADLPPIAQARIEQKLIDQAMKPRLVTFDEEMAFDSSLHGTAYRFWQALKPHHPEIESIRDAYELIDQMGGARLAELQAKLNGADERDLLGKSQGSGTTNHPPADESESRGPSSTDS